MMPSNRTPRVDVAALAVGLGLLAASAMLFLDTAGMTVTAVYGIGPKAMPYAVGGGLALLGLLHLLAAVRDGLPRPDPMDAASVAWMVSGLAGLIACVAFGFGFILAAAVAFTATARAFGRRALLADGALGLGMGLGIYLVFTKLLTLTLPQGPLERLF